MTNDLQTGSVYRYLKIWLVGKGMCWKKMMLVWRRFSGDSSFSRSLRILGSNIRW